MVDNDDVAPVLPKPPPPAPARREAAIDAALRRFDGTGQTTVTPEPSRQNWWSRINRPQLGALVAAGLVALVFAPVAWLTSHQRTVPADQVAADVQPRADLKTFDVAEAPPAAVAPPITKSESRPMPAPEHDAPPPQTMADARSTMVPQQSGAMAERQEDRPAIHVEAPAARAPMILPLIVPREAARAANGSALAQAAPASPPAAKAEVAADRSDEAKAHESIVVTSARRSAGRGDWNACTINDPAHDLARCKRLVDPGAAGTKGQAAAQVADGLARAWQGDYAGAIAAFDQAITIAPKLSLAYLNRGLAHQQQGDLDHAIADLDRAIRYAPHAARGYYNRGRLLRERGDDRRASADEAHALDLDPSYTAVIR